jgi:hypothetical protein
MRYELALCRAGWLAGWDCGPRCWLMVAVGKGVSVAHVDATPASSVRADYMRISVCLSACLSSLMITRSAAQGTDARLRGEMAAFAAVARGSLSSLT